MFLYKILHIWCGRQELKLSTNPLTPLKIKGFRTNRQEKPTPAPLSSNPLSAFCQGFAQGVSVRRTVLIFTVSGATRRFERPRRSVAMKAFLFLVRACMRTRARIIIT